MNKHKRRRAKGLGIGPHHAVSAMGHATSTPNKRAKQRKLDRKRKQRGWNV